MEKEPQYNMRDQVVIIDISTGNLYSGGNECDIFKRLTDQKVCSNCIVMDQCDTDAANRSSGELREPRVELRRAVSPTELRNIAQALHNNGCSGIFQVHYREENKWVMRSVQDILDKEA